MSGYAEKVKRYYDLGLWSEQRVKNAVEKGAVSSDEYEAITGRKYIG